MLSWIRRRTRAARRARKAEGRDDTSDDNQRGGPKLHERFLTKMSGPQTYPLGVVHGSYQHGLTRAA